MIGKFAAGRGPCYALVLSYCGEDMGAGFPGSMTTPTAAMRDRFLQEHPGEPYYLWSPAEWSGAHDYSYCFAEDKPKLEQLSQRLMTIVGAWDASQETKANTLLRGLLRRVAARLGELDWSRMMSITDDFVVTPSDNTNDGGVTPGQDMKACVPKEKLALLKKRKLLPK